MLKPEAIVELDLSPNRFVRHFAVLLAALCVAVLAGCSSPIKLTEPAKVEEGKTQTAVAPPPRPASAALPVESVPAQTQAAPAREVASVTTQPRPVAAEAQPPASLSRIIYFDYDSYEIKPEFQTVLEQHARFLKANSVRRMGLEGHTDERGGREYNLALGQKRSESVARALRLLGVADSQAEAVSFGKEKPAIPGVDEASWAKNRRVELFYK